MLSSGASSLSRTHSGVTPLHNAVARGRRRAAKLLLDEGGAEGTVNAQTKDTMVRESFLKLFEFLFIVGERCEVSVLKKQIMHWRGFLFEQK